jgi:hypothetical protein
MRGDQVHRGRGRQQHTRQPDVADAPQRALRPGRGTVQRVDAERPRRDTGHAYTPE